MAHDRITLDLPNAVYDARFYIIDPSAPDAGNMMVMMFLGTQAVMLFAVELLDPREDAALGQALEITVYAWQAAAREPFLQLVPDLLCGKMRIAVQEEPDDRLPARGQFEPAFFQSGQIPLHRPSCKQK